MTLPWPDQFRELKPLVEKEWGVSSIQLLQQFDDGKSGALVYRVDVECPHHRGLAILKLDVRKIWASFSTEKEQYVKVHRDAPEFAARHFPRLLAGLEQGNQTALLCSYAAESFTLAQSLSRVQAADARRRLVAVVSRGILEDWNAIFARADPLNPAAMLKGWLEYRLIAETGGRIPDYVARYGLSGEDAAPAMHVDGRFLPNPYLFSIQEELWQGLEFIPVKGHQHGDLHEKNIFVRLLPHDEEFFLIDPAFYATDQLLFYDTGYLELSILLRERGSATSGRWLSLLDSIFGSPSETHVTEDDGIVALARAIQDTEEQWMTRHEPGRQDHIYAQRMLARVAAGLNYVNKPASGPVRDVGLLYAAYCLGRLLDRFKIHWEKRGDEFRPISHDRTSPAPTEAWRAVWEACDRFVRHKNVYVLVAGPNLAELPVNVLAVMGRVSWAAVIDFDGNDRLLEAARQSGGPNTVHEIHGDQTDYAKWDVNYEKATAWLKANGVSRRPDTVPSSDQDWRRKYQNAIEGLARNLRQSVAPRSIIVLVVTAGISKYRCQRLYEYLDGELKQEAEYVFVHDGDPSDLPADTNVAIHSCPLPELLSGLADLYGNHSPGEVMVPKRPSHSKEGLRSSQRDLVPLSAEDQAYVRDDLEVVHAGMCSDMPAVGTETSDIPFYRGYTISWTELDADVDAPRSQTPKLEATLREALAGSRNYSLSFYHDPGAGGTTVARRLAWQLKDVFPTVVLERYSSATVSRIRRLFDRTELPVLVIIEASVVSRELRDRLYQELKRTNTRAAFLYVERQHRWEQDRSERERREPNESVLRTPMTSSEAKDFLKRYERWCPRERLPLLKELATEADWSPYRSPFFFGLITFEEKFTKVNDYLQEHVAGITDDAARFVRYLALATRYAQVGVPEDVLRHWLKVPPKKKVDLDAATGCGLGELVVYEGSGPRIKLAHPFLALALIKEVLPWKPGLADLCCRLIKELVEVTGPDANETRELLKLMFIDRGPWIDEAGSRAGFSELVTQIGMESGGGPDAQHRVLAMLTDNCPQESHFWNHRGRHSMKIMRTERGAKYTEAAGYLKKAIELQPDDNTHHHSLGMVYKIEVDERLKKLRRERKKTPEAVTMDRAFGEISDLFKEAENCFNTARQLQSTDGHGYVDSIKMTGSTIIDLTYISDCASCHEFLSMDHAASRWCIEKLSQAEESLRELKRLEPVSTEQYSKYTTACEDKLVELYDANAAQMIEALKHAVSGRRSNQAPLRRVIANCYLRKSHGAKESNWEDLSEGDLKSIFFQMKKIFDHGDVTNRDYWLWFQAVRRLGQEFNMLQVVDRLGKWASAGGSYEAHYYLYLAHFLRCMQGLDKEGKTAEQHIVECKKLVENKRTRRPDDYPELLAIGPKWCPLIATRECGPWKHYEEFDETFVTRTDVLQPMVGTIMPEFRSQAGRIEFFPIQDIEKKKFEGPKFRAFFAPQQRFLPGRDENIPVKFYLCFSYEGFRARLVQRLDGPKPT